MKWLIWKEYRVQRLVLIVGAVLLVLPYAMVLGLFRFAPVRGSLADWCMGLLVAAAYSVGISQLTMALLGGNAIAGERADRSAEFVAYLPLTRARILAAKLTVVLLGVAAIWVPNLLILGFTSAGLGDLVERSYFIQLVGRIAAGTRRHRAAALLRGLVSVVDAGKPDVCRLRRPARPGPRLHDDPARGLAIGGPRRGRPAVVPGLLFRAGPHLLRGRHVGTTCAAWSRSRQRRTKEPRGTRRAPGFSCLSFRPGSGQKVTIASTANRNWSSSSPSLKGFSNPCFALSSPSYQSQRTSGRNVRFALGRQVRPAVKA